MLIKSIVRKTLGLKRHCVERVKDEKGQLAVYLVPDKRYKLVCSGCHERASGYDTLSVRRWKHVPLWGIPVELVYAPRRVECRECGVKVEEIPWAQGKSPLSIFLSVVLATGAKLVAWQVVGRIFGFHWDTVRKAVRDLVEYGLKHRDLTGVACIGVDEISRRKGQPFVPDARMKKILTESVAVGNAIARSDLFASRDPRTRIYPDRQWLTPFVGGSYQFLDGAERLLDARAMFFYYATGITPAMSESRPGTGSAYAGAFRDATGSYLDGGRTYTLTLPGPIPAKNFWALTVYDNQTRSMLPTDQKLAGVDSTLPGIRENPDGGITIWFGPKAPASHEMNWVQTMPGKGYNVLLRLYGPLEPWFNQTWRPGDFELQP
jgi:hypothetical protein